MKWNLLPCDAEKLDTDFENVVNEGGDVAKRSPLVRARVRRCFPG